MRIVLAGLAGDVEVVAEPFEIEGSREEFGVHPTLKLDVLEHGKWTASHVETGFRVASGDTIDAAISAARETWASMDPKYRAARLRRAIEIRHAREAVCGSLQ
jgi:acyl-CoA reductase-like NAD-dependent aldehyde dehydrogenase